LNALWKSEADGEKRWGSTSCQREVHGERDSPPGNHAGDKESKYQVETVEGKRSNGKETAGGGKKRN